ncbi:phosphate signaling complex protein PhoU [Natrialbaceae archaeon A-gly3]
MPRNEYQRQLEDLRTDVLAMSELVQDRLEDALEAFETGDTERAEEIIEGDHEINELYLDLEQDCIELLALQQPVAGDLRFVASTFKIITDLERVGDLATNLGKHTTRAGQTRYPEIDVLEIGEFALEMLEAAMDAYAEDDAAATYEVARTDDDLDAMCEEASAIVVRDLLDREIDDDTLLEDVSQMLLTLRDVERVGDHAVNVAARTLYMVENDDGLIY